ncbi:hypothetical protein Lser_V15G38029 [Lactuca serriola]
MNLCILILFPLIQTLQSTSSSSSLFSFVALELCSIANINEVCTLLGLVSHPQAILSSRFQTIHLELKVTTMVLRKYRLHNKINRKIGVLAGYISIKRHKEQYQIRKDAKKRSPGNENYDPRTLYLPPDFFGEFIRWPDNGGSSSRNIWIRFYFLRWENFTSPSKWMHILEQKNVNSLGWF